MSDYVPGLKAFTSGHEVDDVYYLGQPVKFLFGQGTQILPKLPIRIWGYYAARVVTDASQKWFEFGFAINKTLTGNPATGWTDSDGFFRIDAEWSRDLINWESNQFTAAPVPVVTLGTGWKQYWSRALRPQNATSKTGQLSLVSTGGIYNGPGSAIQPDSRNNPFTALTVNGAVKALGGFPYTMPGDASRMTADMQAFYPGSVVTATSATEWSIIIPGVTNSTMTATNRVTWPSYLVADMFGVVNTAVTGADFYGSFVNASGNTIENKAFARLKITNGNLYPEYWT